MTQTGEVFTHPWEGGKGWHMASSGVGDWSSGGAFWSGVIADVVSVLPSIGISGGTLSSGAVPAPIPVTCHSCGKDLPVNTMTGIARYYTPLFVFSTCLDCAGYDPRQGRVTTRYDWIKDSVPLSADVPDGILADWLEDHGRESDALYIRSRT